MQMICESRHTYTYVYIYMYIAYTCIYIYIVYTFLYTVYTFLVFAETSFYMTFRFSLLEKQNEKNEVPVFLRVDLIYYSLLIILAIILSTIL